MNDELSSVIGEIVAVQAEPYLTTGQTAVSANPCPAAQPVCGSRPFFCTDRRLDFIEVECFPVSASDDAGRIVLAIRDAENRLGIAAWLSRKDALAFADYINRVLA